MSFLIGSCTITDLNDATILTGYINSNLPKTQIYTPDNDSYTPDWVKSNLVLTPELYIAGTMDDMITDSAVESVEWYEGNSATPISNNSNYALSGIKSHILTVKSNILSTLNAVDFTCVITYNDPVSSLIYTHKMSISFSKVTSGGGIADAIAFTPNGNIFKNSTIKSLTGLCQLWRGSAVDETDVLYQWYMQDSGQTTDVGGGVGWKKLVDTSNKYTGCTTKEITIYSSSVIGIGVFKCLITDTDSTSGTFNKNFVDVITMVDISDPFQVIVESSGGDVFKNGVGSTDLRARVFQSETEVDTADSGNKLTYKWYKYDKDGNLVPNFGGSGVNYKTGKTIHVTSAEVDTKATFKAEISYENLTHAMGQLTITCVFDGNDGMSIIWKGELKEPPANPEKNWCYRDTDNGIIYIFNGSSWQIMVHDGNDGIPGVPGSDGLSVFITYNDSETTPSKPTGAGNTNGWHTNMTSTTIWMSQKVSADASTGAWGEPVRIKGQDGEPGKDGTSVKILGSYDTYEELIAAHPTGNENGDGYIIQGDLWVWNGSYFQNVGKIQGKDGIDGTDGIDGQDGVSIIWKGSFASHPANPQNGWSYYNTTDKKSYVYQSGSWYQMTIDGTDGQDGVTTYTWIKYADSSNGSGISNSPINKKYIGFAYNKTTATESNTPSDYIWSLIKGEDGIPGKPGEDGTTTYTWIKYSDNSNGNPCYDIPTANTEFIGIATNKTTATESTNPVDYKWSKFRGDDGIDGTDGLSIIWKGESAAPPANPQKNWCYKDTDNGVIYIWTGTAWEVMVIDGNDGTDGAPGNDGLSVFITYHDSTSTPAKPTGNGTTGGWHTNATSAAIWMSQKIALTSTSGTWGEPIKIKGVDGLPIVWKGELKDPPANPQKNWVYKDTDNGIVYIYNGTSWQIMVSDGNDGVPGTPGTSIEWKGTLAAHPSNPQNGWAYYNSKDKKSYIYQGAWYQMTVDGIDGNKGEPGLSIVWKGASATPPANPQVNWCYRDTDDGIVYIYNGSSWQTMTLDGNDGEPGAAGNDGLSVFITYHDSTSTPAKPTGNGTSGGWHTAPNASCIWMSQKVAESASLGTWGNPIKVKGNDGIPGTPGEPGMSVFITYHDQKAKPAKPTGNGTTGGWHTNQTSTSVWMSQKVSLLPTTGTWGDPVQIKVDNETTETVIKHQTLLETHDGKITALVTATTITKEDGSTVQLKDEYAKTVTTVEGISSTVGKHVTDLEGIDNRFSEVERKADSITNRVTTTEGKFDNYKTAEELEALIGKDGTLTGDISSLKETTSELSQKADGFNFKIEQLEQDKESSTLKNKTVTIDLNGLTVGSSNSNFSSTLDTTGLYIKSLGTQIAKFDNSGAEIRDVKITGITDMGGLRIQKVTVGSEVRTHIHFTG